MPTVVDKPAPEAALGRMARFRQGYLRRSPSIIAAIATLSGLAALIAALPGDHLRVPALTRVIPVPASAAATAITAVAGFILLRVAIGLRKRKRRAWRAGVATTAILVVAHIVKAHDPGQAIVALILLGMLIAARSRFTAKDDPTSRWFAVRVGVQILSVALIYGLGVLYLYPDKVVGHPPFWSRVAEVFTGLVGVDGPVAVRTERFGDVLHGTLLGFGLLMLVSVTLLALRPSEPIARLSLGDEERLRDLLRKQGARDSLGYFALRRDKSVIWSPSGKAAISYRVVHGVALVSGDPIGDPEAWPGVIAEYRRLAEEHAWTPAVVGCSEVGATIFKRECELNAYALGDEAIVEACQFTLEGRPMRGVRQAVTRVERAGYDVAVRRITDVDPQEIHQLTDVAAAWRGDEVERGFSMALSRLGDPSDRDCVVATAHQDGVLRGMLHFVPWGADGLSLDLMRRDRTADNGLNEYMIVKVIEGCSALGVKRVSLNFAVFREAIERGEKIGAGPVLRTWRSVLIFASRWWQIESLYRFNVKFRPYWEPRFLSFPTTRDLPRIAIAALEAEAFLVRPRLMRRMLRRM